MQNISIYLEKFKSLGLKEKECKEMVAMVIKDLTGATVEPKTIDYVDGEVTIKVSGPAKSLVFLNKEKIILEIKRRLGGDGYVSKLS